MTVVEEKEYYRMSSDNGRVKGGGGESVGANEMSRNKREAGAINSLKAAVNRKGQVKRGVALAGKRSGSNTHEFLATQNSLEEELISRYPVNSSGILGASSGMGILGTAQ